MARCGCAGNTTCTCLVTAGENVTVSGTGQAGNPYVISANASSVDVMDTSSIDLTLTPGDPDIISGIVKLDPAAGNLIELTANGLRVDCETIADNCATTVSVDDTDTVDMTQSPGGVITSDVRVDSTTPGNLITVVPGGAPGGLRVDCEDVITCFQAGTGVDPAALATGVIQVCVSTDAGNSLTFGADGCLFAAGGAGAVPTVLDTTTVNMTITPGLEISSDVIIDPSPTNLISQTTTNGLIAEVNPLVPPTDSCGIIGAGTVANPLRANVNPTWPFACPQTNGGDVYCDPATGQLIVDPPHFFVDGEATTPAAGAAPITALDPVGGGGTVVGIQQNVNVVNPSPCRNMVIFIEAGIAHMLFSNPPGGGAGVNQIETNAQVQVTGAASGNTAFQNFGHQNWRASGQVAGDRFAFDSSGAYTGRGASEGVYGPVVIAPGGVATLSIRGFFETIASTTAPPATADGLRFGLRYYGHTV